MKRYTYTAVLHREEDLYVAECPEIGTVSQGYTIEEAMANLREATELYLEEFPAPTVTRPLITTFDVAVYAKIAACLRRTGDQSAGEDRLRAS